MESENHYEPVVINDDPLRKRAGKMESDAPKDFQSAKPGDRIINDLSGIYPKEERNRKFN